MKITMKLLCLPKNTVFAFKWSEEGYHGTMFWHGLAVKDGDSFRINVFVNKPRGFELKIENPECELFQSSGMVTRSNIFLDYWNEEFTRIIANHTILCPILTKTERSYQTKRINQTGQHWYTDRYHRWREGRWSIDSELSLEVVGVELE